MSHRTCAASPAADFAPARPELLSVLRNGHRPRHARFVGLPLTCIQVSTTSFRYCRNIELVIQAHRDFHEQSCKRGAVSFVVTKFTRPPVHDTAQLFRFGPDLVTNLLRFLKK